MRLAVLLGVAVVVATGTIGCGAAAVGSLSTSGEPATDAAVPASTPPTAGAGTRPYRGTTTSSVPLPSDSLASMDQAARDLDWGSIAFNAPGTMTYKDMQTVELVLAPGLSVQDLQGQLQEQTDVESAHIHISNRMEARLAGSGFTIEALRPGLRGVPVTVNGKANEGRIPMHVRGDKFGKRDGQVSIEQ